MTVSSAAAGADSNAEGAMQVKMVTRSGTNDWHGGLFEQHRNQSLNANAYFNNLNSQPRDHLFNPHQRDMDARQRGSQTAIALIFHHDDRSGFSDGEVDAGNADTGRQELPAQRIPGHARQALGVIVHGNAEFLCQELRNCVFGFVNSRCDDMSRTVARQLQQVLAEVGLHDLAPGRLEDLVQFNLLGGHRLTLDDGAIVAAARQVGDHAAGLRAVSDPVHLPAGCDDLTFQLLQVLIEMG